MARFRKRPVIIDAVRIKHRVTINTRNGTLRGYPGDWLVTDVARQRRLCSDDVFRATHEPVDADARAMVWTKEESHA